MFNRFIGCNSYTVTVDNTTLNAAFSQMPRNRSGNETRRFHERGLEKKTQLVVVTSICVLVGAMGFIRFIKNLDMRIMMA